MKYKIVHRNVFLGTPGILLALFISLFPIVLLSMPLLDAPPTDVGDPQEKEIPKTNWKIIRKKMTWGEAYTYCNEKYFRLTVLESRANAQDLVDKLADISVAYSTDYPKINTTTEFGMDRRYWIGLTDQIQEGTWFWAYEGSSLQYTGFWYPGQPDHSKTNKANKLEHCGVLWNPGYDHGNKHSFNDEGCLNEHYAICDVKELPGG